MTAFGFSLNNLTLFGLVLAIGIVGRRRHRGGGERRARFAARHEPARGRPQDHGRGRRRARRESRSCCAAGLHPQRPSLPASRAHSTGSSRSPSRPSTIISATVSLTLSPALAALLLKPHGQETTSGIFKTLAVSVRCLLCGLQQAVRAAVVGLCGVDPAGAAAYRY